jgi:hypothetical protein
MKEKEIIKKVIENLNENKTNRFAVWKSPAFQRMRWDIFNIFDLVVAYENGDIIFIQATTATNLSARRRKIRKYFDALDFSIPNAFIYAWKSKSETFVIEQVV